MNCRVVAVLAAALLIACSKPDTTPRATAASAPSDAPAAKVVLACAMVTQAAMSDILGAAVIARADDGATGRTGCIYRPASGTGPAVELRIEWGMAQIALQGVGMAGRTEPGLASPLAGLGDRAVQVGPALMIASGEDLVTVVFAGVDDTLPKAKSILALVKARL